MFRRVDLSGVKGLEKVIHHGPSTIGLDTLIKSGGKIPPIFLELSGIPRDSIPDLLTWAKKYGRKSPATVFISFGGPDIEFAKNLRDLLVKCGVETFFFPDDADPGERVHRIMWKGVNEFDRVLLVCSRQSLRRSGVLNEIEESLAREAREGGKTILLPVTIDDFLFTEWSKENPETAQILHDRVVANFVGWQEDRKKFELGVNRLYRVLLDTNR